MSIVSNYSKDLVLLNFFYGVRRSKVLDWLVGVFSYLFSIGSELVCGSIDTSFYWEDT